LRIHFVGHDTLDGTGAPSVDCAAAELTSTTMLPSDFTTCTFFEWCFSDQLSGLFGFCMLSSLASVVPCCLFVFSTCVLFPDFYWISFCCSRFPSFIDEHGS
jgi:hypothetical protein